jgi:hypothetical protein
MEEYGILRCIISDRLGWWRERFLNSHNIAKRFTAVSKNLPAARMDKRKGYNAPSEYFYGIFGDLGRCDGRNRKSTVCVT